MLLANLLGGRNDMAKSTDLLTAARFIKRSRRFASVTSGIVVSTGVLAVLGCIMRAGVITQPQLNLLPIKFNTSVCFILLGLSLWLSRSGSTSHTKRLWARSLSFIVVLIGSLSLAEWLSGRNLGIEQLLFRVSPASVGPYFPEPMAAAYAFAFVLLGVALGWLDAGWGRHWLSEWLAVAAGILALLSFIGYFYSVGPLFETRSYITVALYTVVCFVLLSVGVLCVRPNRGLAATLIDTRAGSVLARRLLPVVLLPPFMSSLRQLAQRTGYLDPVVGSALFTMIFMTILTLFILRTAAVLNRADENMRQLSGRLLVLQDEERRRIARELHDSTAQNLGVVTLNLARAAEVMSAVDKGSQTALAETLTLAEQCLREVRTLSYLLHPPLLDEAGLPMALQWYTEGFIKRSGIPVELALPPEMERLSADFEMALFRIVQESLTNICRHANCRHAAIRLILDRDTVTLEVQDDGKGINLNQSGNGSELSTLGVGIVGMRERMRQLGGGLEIESSEHGTRLRAVLHRNGTGQ